jgi:catalase
MGDGDAVEIDEIALATKLVDELHHPEGDFQLRPVHSLGIGASGFFVASPIAKNFCKATHFELYGEQATERLGDARKKPQKTPVTIRFSNASGSAVRHDGWGDVRGMATRFHLADGSETDQVSMTLPEFFTRDARQFDRFAVEAYPKPYFREAPWRKFLDMLRLTPPKRNPYPGETISPDEGGMRYADENPFARLAVFDAASIGAPANYLRAAYHAVHTFIVTAPDGVRRWVRFNWQPIDGVLRIDPANNPEDAARLGRSYLDDRFRERLAKGPARFALMMAVGENGDAFDDPSRPWPPHRTRVEMGTLTIDKVLSEEEQIEDCELLNFNPWRLTEGVEPSGDPVLRVRRYAYEISAAKRFKARGAPQCPFSWS